MRVFLIILRVCVLLLGLGAVGLDGFLTYAAWDSAISKKALHQENVKALKAAETLNKSGNLHPIVKSALETAEKDVRKDHKRDVDRFRMFPFLVVAAVLGLLASLLAMLGRTTSAAVLFFLVTVGPTVIAPLIGLATAVPAPRAQQ